jgi:hypothetical protein
LDQLIEKASMPVSAHDERCDWASYGLIRFNVKWACKENYLIANPVENVLAKRKKTARSQDDRYHSKMMNWNSYSLHTGLKLARVCRTNSGAILTFDLIAIGYPYWRYIAVGE